MNPATRIRAFVEAGSVQRWHTTPSIQDASLARHQWGVAMLVVELVPDPSRDLIRAALLHDVPERWSGDLPLPARLEFGLLKEADAQIDEAVWKKLYSPDDLRHGGFMLDPCEHKWLRFCDCADALLWADSEVRMGNTNLQPAKNKLIEVLSDIATDLDELGEDGYATYQIVMGACHHLRLSDYVKDL